MSPKRTATPRKPRSNSQPTDEQPSSRRAKRLRLIPLGGVGEVGKNCLLLELGQDLVLIDVGVQFPDEGLLGIDLIIPDLRYVAERVQQLRGIVITHGHEDHIGALPYALQQLKSPTPIPVYGSRLVTSLAKAKLEEHRAQSLCVLHETDFGVPIKFGGITIELFPVGHSIPDASGLIIESSAGTVVHTSDFKLGEMPGAGLNRLRTVAKKGVRLLLSDTVRIESQSPTATEATVAHTIFDIMKRAKGRVIVTTFASNVHRLASVIDAAEKLGRQVAIAGRSMERTLGIAMEQGYLTASADRFIRVDQVERIAPDRIVLLTTGSQGEPTSALARIATGEHRLLRARAGDTVILSATPIPGNQNTVSATIDNLFRLGANVFYPPVTSDLHSSGHASREEIGELIDLIKPDFAVPMHGEYRMMALFKQLAAEHGLGSDRVILPEIGRSIEVTKDAVRVGGSVDSGSVLIDGLTVGAVDNVVMRDRQTLASDGIVVVAATVDKATGKMLALPEILVRGFLPGEDTAFLKEAAERVNKAFARVQRGEIEWRLVGERIKDSLGGFIYQRTRLRPMILPVITEV